MSDADKLSQRAFDPMHGGLLLASGAQQLGSTKMGKRKVRYEEIHHRQQLKRFRRRFRVFTQAFSAISLPAARYRNRFCHKITRRCWIRSTTRSQ